MKYRFIPSDISPLTGYIIGPKQKKKKVNLLTSEDKELKIIFICQNLASGSNLSALLNQQWSFSPIEFFSLLEKNELWMSWFNKAKHIRALMTIEIIHEKLRKSELKDDKVMEVVKALKQMAEILKKNEDETGIKAKTTVVAWTPEILKEKGWSPNTVIKV